MRYSFFMTVTTLLAVAVSWGGVSVVKPRVAGSRGLKSISIRDESGAQVELYKGSYALVIGVSDYTAGWQSLPSVKAEVEDIIGFLTANGFTVRGVHNPDDEMLKQEFEQFIDQYGYDPDNRLLIFFSGHGYSRRKGSKGYLVPADAPDPRTDERGFLRKALPMSQIQAWARQMEAKHVLFLFDSCFSGTVFKTKALPKVPRHISSLTARPVRQFIAAGDAGEEVPAKSVFSPCFVRGLRGAADLSGDGYVTGSELGMYLHDKVIYYGAGQTPQYGKIRDPDLDQGDFVFRVSKAVPPTASAAAPARPAPPAAPTDAKGLRLRIPAPASVPVQAPVQVTAPPLAAPAPVAVQVPPAQQACKVASVLTWNGKVFRAGDRVQVYKQCGAYGPEKTGVGSVKASIGKGRDGTFVRGEQRRSDYVTLDPNRPIEIAVVRWDKQTWFVWKGPGRIKLPEFEATIHPDYLEVKKGWW
jgi:hypothetical protein